MTPPIIEVKDLRKYFVIDRSLRQQITKPFGARKKVCSLKEVSFSIQAGEILGVVGPNGAGKTTLLRILADLLEPDSGCIKFCGNILDNKVPYPRGKIGYVSSDERSFFWRLSGRENLEFFAALYGMPAKQIRQRTSEMLQTFDLETKADQLFRDYSTGTRKKFAVIRALLHCPPILFLDEVTNSLDPESSKTVKALIREYVSSQKNRVAAWSTHRLEEIAEICDMVLVIAGGQVRFYGRIGDFQNNYSLKTGYIPTTKNSDNHHLFYNTLIS